MGWALVMMSARPMPRIGMTTRKISASLGLMRRVSTQAQINMMGDRTAIRMTIIKAIWTLVTSVVRRVMMPLVENLSMLAKENFWTFRYISRRRFRAKPVEALAPKRPDSPPQISARTAIPTTVRP